LFVDVQRNPDSGGDTVSVAIDYRQRLLEETSDLSPVEMEKIYQAVVVSSQYFVV